MANIRVIPIGPGDDAQVDVLRLRNEVKNILRDTTKDGQRVIAKYPPQRLTATGYRRTGTLKRSWSSRVKASSARIEGEVGSNRNIAPYNKLVQGRRKDQVRRFRRAGWTNVDDLEFIMQNEFEPKMEALFTRFAV